MAIFDVIIGIIMFVVALVILNTMLMAVMERYHEIGVDKRPSVSKTAKSFQ